MNLDVAEQLEAGIDAALARGDHDSALALAEEYHRAAGDEMLPAAALTLRFRAGVLAARVALEAGRLRQAIDRLARLMPLPDHLPVPLRCRIWLMSSEALARVGRHGEARGHLERALAFDQALKDNPHLHLRALRIRLWLGDVADLDTEIEDCVQRLEALQDRANLTLLLGEHGRAWDAAGQLDRARACWQRALRESQGLGGDPARADILIQMGRLHHLMGELQAALDHLEAAAACTTVLAQRLEARLRRLLVLLDLHQHAHAADELSRLLAGHEPLPEELDPLVRMVRAVILGTEDAGTTEAAAYRAARSGQLREAALLYRRALQEAPAPARQARLCLALGMLAMASGEGKEARSWLARAEYLARTHALFEVLWRCLAARGQLMAEVDGDEAAARALFEEAVLVSETQRSKLTSRVDAAAHGMRSAEVLERLLLAACRRGDAGSVFRYQETQRGRFLLELWRAAPAGPSRSRLAADERLGEIDRRLAACPPGPEMSRLLFERERLLDAYLRDRSRASAAVPGVPEIAELEKALKPGDLYVAPALVRGELYVLVAQAGRASRVVAGGTADELSTQVAALRHCLDGQLDRYRQRFPLGRRERSELDAHLETLGRGILGDVLGRLLDEAGPDIRRVLWVPDGVLHGLPIPALRRGGRYLVERFAFVTTFGGALIVHQARRRGRHPWIPRAVVLCETPEVLPAAAQEGHGVAGAFWRARLLQGKAANREVLRRELGRAAVVHLACHAYFDAEHPLSAHIGLPSGENWHALEWLDEALEGLPLVTLSACRSAEVGPLVGREVFGLVTGLLGAGVRGVVAGLWPLADRETLPLMWRFYRHRMLHGVPEALALAQREALSEPDGSPLFWAALSYFGDPNALPGPGRWSRWLARWRQGRHARAFPHSPVGS